MFNIFDMKANIKDKPLITTQINYFCADSLYQNLKENDCAYQRVGSRMRVSMKLTVSTDCEMVSVYLPSKLSRDDGVDMFVQASLNKEKPLEAFIESNKVGFNSVFKENDIIDFVGDIPIKEWRPVDPYRNIDDRLKPNDEAFIHYLKGGLQGLDIALSTSKDCVMCKSARSVIGNLIKEIEQRNENRY